AVGARLLRVARLGQDRPGPRTPGRGRRRYTRALHRGVRAADRDPLRGVPRAPRGGARVKATVLVRPKPGILDPQGQAVESSLLHLGFAVAETRVGKLVELDVDADDEADARGQ